MYTMTDASQFFNSYGPYAIFSILVAGTLFFTSLAALNIRKMFYK